MQASLLNLFTLNGMKDLKYILMHCIIRLMSHSNETFVLSVFKTKQKHENENEMNVMTSAVGRKYLHKKICFLFFFWFILIKVCIFKNVRR